MIEIRKSDNNRLKLVHADTSDPQKWPTSLYLKDWRCIHGALGCGLAHVASDDLLALLVPITIVRKRRACCLEALMRFHFPAPLRRRIEFSHRGLHRNSEDERTVKTACLNSDLTLVFTTVRQVRTGTRGTHRGQKNNLPSKAEYVDANCSSRPQSPLAFMGGPYTVSLNPVHLDENRLIGYVLFSMLDSN
jgi:hypothetical protein